MYNSIPLENSALDEKGRPHKVFLFETLPVAPHLHTTLELAQRHLECGHEVTLFYWADALPYNEPWFTPHANRDGLSPFDRGAQRLEPKANLEKQIPLTASQLAEFREFVDKIEFDSLDALMSWQWRGASIGMAVVSSLITNLRSGAIDPRQHIALLRSAALTFMICYESTATIIAQTKPSVAYVFNGRFAAQKGTLSALQEAQVTTCIHERGSSESRFAIFSTAPHDRRYLQSEIAKFEVPEDIEGTLDSIAEKFYSDRRAGAPKDWYSFITGQSASFYPERIRDRKGKKLITYFTSSDDEFVAVADAFCQQGFKTQQEAVTCLLKVTASLPDYLFVIRMHPHLQYKNASESSWYLNMPKGDNVVVLPADSEVHSYRLLADSDLVITYGSTIGIEAAYWKRPSLLLGSSLYDELGSTYQAYNEQDLMTFLQSPDNWVAKNQEGAVRYGAFSGSFGLPFKYYESNGLFMGKFKGKDLNVENITWRTFPQKVKGALRRGILVVKAASRVFAQPASSEK